MTVAAILGLDTAAGAYLARLLGARGHGVRGTGGPALLERLGIAGDVTIVADVAAAIAGADDVYDLRGDAVATRALLTTINRHRLFVAVDPGDAASIATLAEARAAGRFIATGRVYPHESRLGPGTSPVARIVAAVASARDPAPADLATATDCGWTPEYVDAMWRMLALPAASDLTIASGHVLAGDDVGRVAGACLRRSMSSAAARATVPADYATPLVGGWRAITVGDELVEVLCDGAANWPLVPC